MPLNIDRENSGLLFKNERKEKESQPDYRGQVNIDGTQLKLSAWIKSGKNGKFMSLSFGPLETERPKQEVPETDEDIPF